VAPSLILQRAGKKEEEDRTLAVSSGLRSERKRRDLGQAWRLIIFRRKEEKGSRRLRPIPH